MPYAAPLKDIRFALDHAAGLWSVQAGGAYPDLDADLLAAILDGAGQLAAETLAPLNQSGDREGVRLENGVVRAAAGFPEAYARFVEGGWQGLAADPAHGGQGLPKAVALAVHEMIHAANMAFGLAPMLTLGAIECLEAHGSDEQKAVYLEKLVSGAWTGTMNLTEPQAGSDVGALTSRATPNGDGSYAITGQKIYITWGEHDLAENIVHLVLARLPDAPPGSKGVSLFVVPKNLPTADGRPGVRNALRCIGLERKMGIHASPTCTMAYEGATGWLIGAPHAGLAAMFTMMNAARLNVGLQGVAVAEAAYQKALDYARERRQGRAEGATEKGPAPILLHADVRRMLLAMKAKIQAGRAICYATAVAADRALTGSDADRAFWKAREDLLTPIAKAWCTDMGVEVASQGVQVHGGMGFVEDGGAAQFYRDARIAPIYEGTNGIQAIDLIGRKLSGDGGAAMAALVAEAKAVAGDCVATGRFALERLAKRLDEAVAALEDATAYILSAGDRRDALAGATPYLKLAGDVVGGALLARGVLSATAAGQDPQHATAQEALAGFYAETVLAAAPGLAASIKVGADPLYDPNLEDFTG
ncbi:MAG: acyl-CoA dehydrogenase C-terminal domain-containing protein [Alphaproteobacteria bacterium]|nr:acyl-CoA dehydrogenase C-terminal domain-containing protein [Alphaproteobacteria bacterium]